MVLKVVRGPGVRGKMKHQFDVVEGDGEIEAIGERDEQATLQREGQPQECGTVDLIGSGDEGFQPGEFGRPMLFFGAGDFGQINERRAHGGIEVTLDDGKKGVTDAVAQVARVAISGIFAPRLLEGAEISFDLVPAGAEKWPDNACREVSRGIAKGRNGGETAGPGAAQDAKKDGLGLVVESMGGGDLVAGAGFEKLLEKCVAHIAGRRLEAELLLAAVARNVAAMEVQRKIEVLCQIGNKLLVGVGVGAPDAVMDVDHTEHHTELAAQPKQRTQQGNAISPAGDGDTQAVAGLEQRVGANVFVERGEHGVMVQLGEHQRRSLFRPIIMKRLLQLLAFTLVIANLGVAENSWHAVDPGFRVFFVAAHGNTLWACGTGESIAQSDDNGAHWTVRHHQQTGATLLGVELVTDHFGYAYGTGGTLLFTDDGGQTWTAGQNAPGTILMASFSDKTHGLVRTRRELLFTTDGDHWTTPAVQQNTDALKRYRFTYALAALDAQHLAVLLKEGSAQYEGTLIVSTIDGGKSWTVEAPPSTVIYGLLRKDDRYWLEGIEVVDKDKPGGGHSVPLLKYSSDGREWMRVKNDLSACQMELCTLCNNSGCVAGNGALVRPFGETTRLAGFEPLKELTPVWAANETVICTAGSRLRCADLKPIGKGAPEGAPALPTQAGIASQNTENSAGPQCIRCELDHVLVSAKAPQGAAQLTVKFQLNPDGTVGKVEVSGAPSNDVKETLQQHIGEWLFEPLNAKSPMQVQIKAQIMVIHGG